MDAASGQPLIAARVTLPATGRHALTDATGAFLLRGLDPGSHAIRVEDLGHLPADTVVEVGNGRTRTVRFALLPVVPVPGVEVSVRAVPGGGHRVVVADLIAPGATAGDLLRAIPGVVVVDRGTGSRQTVSIRGSEPRAVLVLVDGVPVNDPLTGEADLSRFSAASVAEAVVLPGARSARYGPGAEAGVVLLSTLGGSGCPMDPAAACGSGSPGRVPGPTGVLGFGSLGEARAALTWTGSRGGPGWRVRASGQHTAGGFAFERPPEAGGGRATRVNADVTRASLEAGLVGGLAGGEGRVQASVLRLARGLPGRSYAPTPQARQMERHGRVTAAWQRSAGIARLVADAWVAGDRVRNRDPAPPAGPAYDETTSVATGGFGVQWTARPHDGVWGEVGAGAELRHQRVASTSLEPSIVARTRAGAFATASLRPLVVAPSLEVTTTLRVDRLGLDGTLHASHEVVLSGRLGPARLHAAHRSAYRPPDLSDQLFREGVGVRPNPDLRGERVPGELEVGADLATTGPVDLTLGAGVTAYRGDVEDMVVWAPDFRFVWSPRNVDVHRSGLDVRGRLARPLGPGELAVEATWGLARVTYDRPGLEGLQVRYRPRHTGRVGATWRTSGLRVAVEGHYTGARHPVPSPANVLPGFWSLDVAAAGRLAVGGWVLGPTLRVERLLDARDAMIFGFPEPGRTMSVGLEVRPAPFSRKDPP